MMMITPVGEVVLKWGPGTLHTSAIFGVWHRHKTKSGASGLFGCCSHGLHSMYSGYKQKHDWTDLGRALSIWICSKVNTWCSHYSSHFMAYSCYCESVCVCVCMHLNVCACILVWVSEWEVVACTCVFVFYEFVWVWYLVVYVMSACCRESAAHVFVRLWWCRYSMVACAQVSPVVKVISV